MALILNAQVFDSAPTLSGMNIYAGTIPLLAIAGTAMDISTAQTVTAIKTFSAPPVLSGASITSGTIPLASLVGGATAFPTLGATQTWTGSNTYSLTLRSPSLTITDSLSNVFVGTGLKTGVTGSYNICLGAGVFGSLTSGSHNIGFGRQAFASLSSGTGNIAFGYQSGANVGAGNYNTFIGYQTGIPAFQGPFSFSTAIGQSSIITEDNQIVLGTLTEKVYIQGNLNLTANGPTTGNVLTTDDSGNATWQAPTVYVSLNGTNEWTGTNTFNSNLPTSTVDPVNDEDLVTKLYVGDNFASISSVDITAAGTNVFSGTNTFNTNLPTSTATPTTGTQLITKTFADATYAVTATTPISASVATTNNTPTTLATIAIPSNKVVTINGIINAANAAYSDATGGTFNATCKNQAGTASIVGNPIIFLNADTTASFNVIRTTTNLIIQVTGLAATTYNWNAKYTVTTN
jgi:hypothetical protein